MVYIAYLGVTVPLLLERIRHRRERFEHPGLDEHGNKLVSLGHGGIPINVLAVTYPVAMVVNLMWPRAAVYDVTGKGWWLPWSAVLFVALTLAVGYAIHQRVIQRGRRAHDSADAGVRGRPRGLLTVGSTMLRW